MSKVVYPQQFEILGISKQGNVPSFYVNGNEKYCRILVQPRIKEEDRNYEIYDEDEDTIYRVPEWMIPQIIEKIEYRRMRKDWVKTNIFNGEQQENFSAIENMLFHSGDNEVRELINNQRLEKLQPKAYTYDELIEMALPLITKEAIEKHKRRIVPIYRMRGEEIPTIFEYLDLFFKK